MADEIKILREIADLQSQYESLCQNNKLTKKAICDLVIPFRDKYRLSDVEAFSIARSQLSIAEILKVIEKSFDS